MKNHENMIKILHLITTMPVGGAENLILTTLRKLDSNRFESIVCCIQSAGALGEEAKRAGYRVIELNRMEKPGFDSLVAPLLEALLISEKINVLHCHLYHAGMYGRLASRKLGIPAILTVHNTYTHPKLHRRIVNYLLEKYTYRIIAVANAVQEDISRYDWIPTSKIEVIPNGIDISPYTISNDRGLLRSSLGLPTQGILLGTLGRLERQKGHFFLLRALSEITRSTGDCPHVCIIGNGSELDNIARQISSLGLRDRVHLLGERRDIASLLSSLDIFVLPSLWEGLPLALLEAMASGLPVIATRVGGICDVISDGQEGILIPAGEYAPLQKAIMELSLDPNKRTLMGKMAKKRVENHHNVETMVQRLEKIYFDACKA